MKSILLTLLLIVQLLPFHAQKGTRSEPCTINDSCGVLYTHKQDERCLLTFIKVELQDSIIRLQSENIKRADSIMYEQLNTINEQEDELKRIRKNVYKAGFGGLVGGFLIGLMTWGIVLIN
jgi:uncharacterized protein YdeI (YjbR/CyaY-like superfamily)